MSHLLPQQTYTQKFNESADNFGVHTHFNADPRHIVRQKCKKIAYPSSKMSEKFRKRLELNRKKGSAKHSMWTSFGHTQKKIQLDRSIISATNAVFR